MWSFCLTSKEGRKIVKLPPTATTKNLYETAEKEFGSKIAALKFGFPPKLASSNDDQIIESILQNQERIQVEFDDVSGDGRNVKDSKQAAANKKSKSKSKSKPVETNSSTKDSTASQRPKRAAAQQATENMPAVIKAQEKMLKEQQQKSSKSAKRQRTTSSSAAASPSNGNRPVTKRNTKPAAPKFTASVGEGRRLADGATIAAPKTSTSRKRSSPAGSLKSSNHQTSDMSEALLGALNDSGKMGQVLRRGMKNAVQASYETSRAFSRLAAVQAKTFTMTVAQEAGGMSKLMISYQGSVDKKKEEEHVDCIPRDVLEAVLKGIHASNAEALRPENLALLSPRVLWSLVHIFPNQTSIPEMYRELLPDVDWNFLRRRAQQLSEKALENLRQEQEANGAAEEDQRAIEAVAAVEQAMENLQGYTTAERQARQAQAALRRLQSSSGNGNAAEAGTAWKLETPTEPDRDELRECMDGATSSDQMTTLINRLMRECQIHNWRELANVTDVAELASKLKAPSSQVQTWVDRAQDESVAEIIVEICDNNVEAVELLTETARSGTPKDLAMWRTIPQLLHQRMAGRDNVPSIEDLCTWSQRAHQTLQDYEWLNWFATPVE